MSLPKFVIKAERNRLSEKTINEEMMIRFNSTSEKVQDSAQLRLQQVIQKGFSSTHIEQDRASYQEDVDQLEEASVQKKNL